MTEQELNEQLKASLDSLEKANQSERMFFANISHDMRTPMNAVLGFADLALRETRADKMRPYLQKIRQSGEILLSLINNHNSRTSKNNWKGCIFT